MNSVLPIYSQYQTALPGTLAHYLLGICCVLSREQHALQSLYCDLDCCPLGAGAGGGTTFAINPQLTAKMLGFSRCSVNSLDAIASRDLALRIFAAFTILATTLSRLTVDLQLWSTQEFGFITFSDCLCGVSSMMPQKKNPYLLEKIQGRLAAMLGYFTTATTAMHKIPFGNSVTVGTEALKSLNCAFDDLNDAVSLLMLHLNHMTYIQEKTAAAIVHGYGCATYATERLVQQQQYTFKEAHHFITTAIKENAGHDALENITGLQTPLQIAHQMEYGGGPGCNAMQQQYHQLCGDLQMDAAWIEEKILRAKMQDFAEKELLDYSSH